MNYTLIALNCRFSHSCQALFYLRNELEGHLPCQVTISQRTINDPYYDTLLSLSDAGPDVLFFSVYIWNSDYVERLLHDLALIRPDLPLVLGGPQAPALEGLPENCTVVQGEIEGVGEQFYSDLAGGRLQPLYEARGGRPFASPYRPQDFQEELKDRHVYYESTRGCPFACSYCLSSTSRGLNALDLAQVTEELGQIVSQQPKQVKFVDRTFNADPKRALELWRFLAEQPGSTDFHFEIAPDLFTEEMFDFLADLAPGRFQFEIGVQSTHAASLAAVNRRMDLEAALANIKRLVAMDTVYLHLDLILGLPFETEDSFRQGVNLIFNLHPHKVQMGLLKILPNTPISSRTREFGLKFCQKPPYQVMATAWLDHGQLSRLYWLGECLEAFYNKGYFHTFFSYLLSRRQDLFAFFEELLAVCLEEKFFERAKTQKLMSAILARVKPGEPTRELLIFDWLASGHRYLPDHLESGDINRYRDRLWKRMPENLPGFYSHQAKNEFFKQGVFFRFSEETLRAVALEGEGEFVRFGPQKKEGVRRQHKAVRLKG